MQTFLITFLLFPAFLFAQIKYKKELNNPNRLKTKEYKLSIKEIAPVEIQFPFSKIEVIDNRFDTSKFGFIATSEFFKISGDVFKKMTFKGGTA